MPLAISDDHKALADTVADFLAKHRALAANRELLEAPSEERPAFWAELADLGWLGLHLPEEYGGSGFGLPELAVVVEQLGRAACPGPFVPTAIASATIAAAGPDDLKKAHLPALADGSRTAGIALGGGIRADGGRLSGTAPAVLGGTTADLFLLPVGDGVAVVDRRAAGVSVEEPRNVDPARRSTRVTLDGAEFESIDGGREALVDLARVLLAAEATGVASLATEMAAQYARDRIQFGRPIGTYQAVKHHCANMAVATELATSAVWDAARAATHPGESQLSYAAAIAASLAVPAAVQNAQLNIQVHGGIGFTWEHDAHLYLRRAVAIAAVLEEDEAARVVTDLTRAGVKRSRAVELPPEAERYRQEVRDFVQSVKGKDKDGLRDALIASGYAVPHWPRPWGRDAGAIEQLVIEQEFQAAGVRKPQLGITGWVILTLIQHATDDQIARWVRPALGQELIWCQLFSEPDAGSDAAGIKTRGKRVEGGWLVNGQKVWTSGAQHAAFGLATIRTDPDAPKHKGITMMVIDMHGEGVTVRPLRQVTGDAEFNEVFFNDVFVPDDDVVGPVDGGWTVARATLGNESVSIGGGGGGMTMPFNAIMEPFDANPGALPGGAERIGRYIAQQEASELLNMRSAHRAVAGGGPGPEGAITKLVLSELRQEAGDILATLAGPNAAYLEGPGAAGAFLTLGSRALSIAGGTSEIKRNQIGERILGLPRDPLIN
ncbi:MAG TPA: acyl-CoA dehydrogenase [Acidimicrobiales bacterium]|nr:acyl-CoA dehydrogenase [Acidimicrobiales bacterium]